VTRSVNEVTGLAVKAARGAGAPPAQAAQFGAAAVVHLCAGRDVQTLDAALDAVPAGPIMEYPLALARIAEAQKEGIAKGAFEVDTAGLAQSYVEALPCQASLTTDHVLHLDLNRPAERRQLPRIALPNEIYARWSALAAKLLVPESAASRISGAGAGLTDND
jgi:hypothetical protein